MRVGWLGEVCYVHHTLFSLTPQTAAGKSLEAQQTTMHLIDGLVNTHIRVSALCITSKNESGLKNIPILTTILHMGTSFLLCF